MGKKDKDTRKLQREQRGFEDPYEIKIVCTHKSGNILSKRPATLGVAVVEMGPRSRRVFLDWEPLLGNMNNRRGRKNSYNPVAVDQAVPPLSGYEREERGMTDEEEETLSHSDYEGIRRRGVKGMTSTRRNAVSNHFADQFICPRCTMHVSRDHVTVGEIVRGLAEAGVTELDIQYIDLYAQMLPKPTVDWSGFC